MATLTFEGTNLAGKITMDYQGNTTVTPYRNGGEKSTQVGMTKFDGTQYIVALPGGTVTKVWGTRIRPTPFVWDPARRHFLQAAAELQKDDKIEMAKMMNRDRHAYICPAVVVIAAGSGEGILTTASGMRVVWKESSAMPARSPNNFFSNEEDSAGKNRIPQPRRNVAYLLIKYSNERIFKCLI